MRRCEAVSDSDVVCFHPLKGWRAAKRNENGKRPITFKRSLALVDMPVTLPCGQCKGCRLDRSRSWAIRCVHEAQSHKHNSFVTLTFNEENVPEDWSLSVETHQLFMKRMRRMIDYWRSKEGLEYLKIKFYMCGEYGSQYGRPHYHYLLFGWDFPDKYFWRLNKRGERLYRSPMLERLWPFGYSSIGSVTFESAAYVARYVMKKVTGDSAEEHYQWLDTETGEVFDKVPEFNKMSNGVGKEWYLKYGGDVYPHDFVVIKDKRFKPPQYYDRMFEVENPEEMKRIKGKRKRGARKNEANSTPERLRVREKVMEARTSTLKRELD